MKLMFAYAEGVLKGLNKLDQSELPLMLFAKVHRVLQEVKNESAIYMPKREKILQELCTLEKGEGNEQFWKFPNREDGKYEEFVQRWDEIQTVILDIKYSPIDYLEIIEKTPEEIKNKITATGKDFDILDSLNETYKKENSPADTSAGEANKGAETPTPDV